MRTPEEKLQHSRRLQQKENHIRRQVHIAKNYGMAQEGKWQYLDQPHRNHKKAILNCGDPNCFLCMNPRKALGEETIQERKHKQAKFYRDDVDNKDDLS